MSKTHGHFNWNELVTHNPAAARDFYETTLGWTFEAEQGDAMTYWVAHADGVPVGGLMGFTGERPADMPSHWVGYIAVDDVDARVAAARSAGATVLRAPFDVPFVGRVALLKDPTGGYIGWVTPTDPPAQT
ncbi:MAG: VOC family protein [Pseudomonadota bacterium]